MNTDEFLTNPYTQTQKEKDPILLAELKSLTQFHIQKCSPYARLLKLFYPDRTEYKKISDIPYLPVNLFKTQELLSIDPKDVFKVLQSSGTTSSHPSKIFLDVETAKSQTLALANIMTSFLGPKRLPMLVIDHPNVIQDRKHYNARGAALVGMMNFGRDIHYALNEKMELNRESLRNWLKEHEKEPLLLFGLTFVIWEHFLNLLKPHEFNFPEGILFHTGGWKKLKEQAISNEMFKEKLLLKTGIKRCHNFYGMAEQVGSVFVECEKGNLHCPRFADIVIRNPHTWEESPLGEEGVIQVLSILPRSYPGHSLLTEDIGVVLGIDDCGCGRKGKYFQVLGRIPQAEIRGCSDTYAYAVRN